MLAGRRLVSRLILLGSLLLAGCRNRDLVENELRARDIQYREALDELNKAESRAESLQRELDAVRQGAKITPEQAAQSFGLKRITLGRLTGGYDNDGVQGDEALQIVIEPRDFADHTIKAPGQAEISALEISPQGVKTPIGDWRISAEQLRASWKYGLLGTGYYVILPWRTLPQVENLRVVARFITADGRTYEADKDVKVRLVPGRGPRQQPPDAPPPELTPSLKQTYPNVPASHWTPASLEGVVELGRPVPYEPQQPAGLEKE